MGSAPVIHVSAMGNLGNRMIQFMAAHTLAQVLDQPRLSRVELPEWGILHEPIETDSARTIVISDEDTAAGRIDFETLRTRLAAGDADAADIRCYAQNAANFLPPDAYRPLFPDAGLSLTSRRELLINIRQGDILDAHHPDYVLLPVDFYADLVEQTGLSPVFMGQLDETPYLDMLRRRFPEARFLPSQGALADFSIIRNASNIVLSVSSFSWVAAYLSHAQRIIMPLLGLLHPLQSRGTDLMPADDPRWRFHLFPFHFAVTQDKLDGAHAALRGLWREMPYAELRALFANVPAVPPRGPEARIRYLLESAYLRGNPDVAEAVREGGLPSGRHHYAQFGCVEGRPVQLIDPAFYCTRYPIAAVELGQGAAADCFQHWLEIGSARGYRRSEQEG